MVIKFGCTTDDKKAYYEIKRKISFHRATLIRERQRDLRDDFFCEFDVLSHGRSLYRELKESGLCKTLVLFTQEEES
jgi:hypothetical protein